MSVGVAVVEPRVVLEEVPLERDDLDVHRYHNDLVSASLRGGEGSSGPFPKVLRQQTQSPDESGLSGLQTHTIE